MGRDRIRATAPYAIGLVAAAILFVLADRIQYTARPGQFGPDFWPKLAIGLLGVVCAWEIARGLLGARASAQGIAEILEHDGDAVPDEPSQPRLLAGGIALLAAYALLVNVTGFLLSTFMFLVAFMYLGRYRNHLAIWLIGTGMTLAVAFLFLRFAYVSLPRGVAPFDRFTDFVRVILGG